MNEIQPSSGLFPGTDEMGHSGLNLLHLWRHPQKTKTKTKQFFLQCSLEDLPSLLSVWTALWHNRLASCGVARWREDSGSSGISRYDIFVHRQRRIPDILHLK